MDCCPSDSSVHRNAPGKNTGVSCHALLQGSSPSSNATCVSCVCGIAGGFFTAELPGKSKGTIWMSIRIHSYSGRSDQYKLVCVCVLCIPQIKYQGYCYSYKYIGSQPRTYSTLAFLHKLMGPLNSCSFSDDAMKLCYLCVLEVECSMMGLSFLILVCSSYMASAQLLHQG